MSALLERPDRPAPVLVAGDYAQGSRARRGERMDHLFEQRCDWITTYGRAGHLAVFPWGESGGQGEGEGAVNAAEAIDQLLRSLTGEPAEGE